MNAKLKYSEANITTFWQVPLKKICLYLAMGYVAKNIHPSFLDKENPLQVFDLMMLFLHIHQF